MFSYGPSVCLCVLIFFKDASHIALDPTLMTSLWLKYYLLSRVWLFVIPWAVTCQAPLSMKFSRQEYWSGLSFPSPWYLLNPGIEPRSPALQADSLPPEPPGKPRNTGVGSLSSLQGIFPTQELNRGLLHCRWILYPQSYQGSPHANPYYSAYNDAFKHIFNAHLPSRT